MNNEQHALDALEEKKEIMEGWTDETLQDNIKKNIRAISVTSADISLSVMDCDLEETKKQARWLISQTAGLDQMILEVERRGIDLSR